MNICAVIGSVEVVNRLHAWSHVVDSIWELVLQIDKQLMLSREIASHQRHAEKRNSYARQRVLRNFRRIVPDHQLGQLVLEEQRAARKVDANVVSESTFLNEVGKYGAAAGRAAAVERIKFSVNA